MHTQHEMISPHDYFCFYVNEPNEKKKYPHHKPNEIAFISTHQNSINAFAFVATPVGGGDDGAVLPNENKKKMLGVEVTTKCVLMFDSMESIQVFVICSMDVYECANARVLVYAQKTITFLHNLITITFNWLLFRNLLFRIAFTS